MHDIVQINSVTKERPAGEASNRSCRYIDLKLAFFFFLPVVDLWIFVAVVLMMALRQTNSKSLYVKSEKLSLEYLANFQQNSTTA